MSALLSYRNLVDAAASVLSVAGGSTEDSAHPISNLKLRGLGQYFQIEEEFGDMTVDVDFGSSKTFNFIAAMGLGMSSPNGSGTITLQYATSIDGISYGPTEDVSVSDFAEIFLPGSIMAVIPGTVSTRYLRVFLGWSNATPPRFARLWVDNALILSNRIEADAGFGFQDAGQLDKTDGQQYVEFERPRTKSSGFNMRGLSTLEAWGFAEDDNEALNVTSINGLQFAAGTTGEAIIIPIIKDTLARDLWIRRTSVYGHLASDFAIRQDGTSENWQASFSLIEER